MEHRSSAARAGSAGFARVIRAVLATLAVAAALTPGTASAQAGPDRAFFNALQEACSTAVLGSPLAAVCNDAFSGRLSPGGPFVPGAVAVSFATASTQTGVENLDVLERCVGSPAECAEKKARKRGGGASADILGERLGFSFSLQRAQSNRDTTLRELGYEGTLTGGLLGVDYRFTDRLLAGLQIGYARNESELDFAGGSVDTSGFSTFLQGTYAVTDNAYLGGYLGYQWLSNDGTRNVLFGGIAGTTAYSNDGSVLVAGASGGYNWPVGNWTVGGFANLDYAHTRMDGFTELGTTGLEFTYPSQTMTSLLGMLGARVAYTKSFDWGTLSPELRVAWAHEFENDARTITSSLVINPVTTLTVVTDNPDRNFALITASAIATVGPATTLFLNYQSTAGHGYLSTWAVAAGAILGF